LPLSQYADENSDIDFLVIAESDLPRFKRSRRLYKLFKPYPFGMDILVYTPAEMEKGSKTPFFCFYCIAGRENYLCANRLT